MATKTSTGARTGRFALGVTMAITVLTASLTACTVERGPNDPPTAPEVRLISSDSCEELVSTTREQLEAGLDDQAGERSSPLGDSAVEEASGEDAAASGGSGMPTMQSPSAATGSARSATAEAGPAVAGPNQQEEGVAEGDPVATDGRRIVTVVNGVLRVTQLDDSPAIDGTVDLQMRRATEVLLRGDEAVVIGGGPGLSTPPIEPMPLPAPEELPTGDGSTVEGTGPAASGAAPGDGAASRATTPPTTSIDASTTSTTTTITTPPTASTTTTTTTTTTTASTTTTAPPTTTSTVPLDEPGFSAATTITLVDLSNPGAPRTTGTVEVEGTPVATRMVDGTVRIVVRSVPAFVQEMWQNDLSGVRAALNRMDGDDLLPRIRTGSGEIAAAGGCSDVLLTPPARPATAGAAEDYSSYYDPGAVERVTILSVGRDLSRLDPVSIQGAAETVYASTEGLWVASTRWDPNGPTTAVHRFSMTGDGPATYTGSGSVPGQLLDKYSLSERDGHLRIVTTALTTTPDANIGGTPLGASAGRLGVLRIEGDRLVEVGRLEGLGIDEQVRSVRFLDDTAYVVTFRQTDPLFAIDVSEPAAPRVLGELKIPGFSEYLHPVGDGRLLGIGRDVDPATLEDRGLKLSLFDVSDPAAPTEQQTIVLEQSWSPVATDPHSLTWDPLRRRAAFPVSSSDGTSRLLVLAASADGLEEVASLRHGEGTTVGHVDIFRSVVVGEDLWTVSSLGLGRSPADDPRSVELIPF